jgi:hypothetical protein
MDNDGCRTTDGYELLTECGIGKKGDHRRFMVSGMRKESRGRWHVNSDLKMTCEMWKTMYGDFSASV